MAKKEERTKRKALIETAKGLFLRHGFRRVTVEEICRKAQVSKMTFYKYFRNKTDLAKAFYLESHEQGMEEYRGVMNREIPFAEKVELLVQLRLQRTEDISKEFVQEMVQHRHAGLLEFMEKKGREAIAEMIRDFQKAAEKGEIRQNINPLFITYFFERMQDMIADERLQNLYENEQELLMELTNFFFYGLGIRAPKQQKG